ncbi:hypothetical protein CPB83DRAFT_850931 [Crepidotus variabilis]|uniref:Trafficking protein particle complex subunit 12 n=1 Tax=Crepidotus variabilis TaxID=179855 RepID=A0A9P6EKE6_9AGAR|nr:hypothetical protein CPB83DRAFT_850931 [Crepidotus variabilis]
MPRYLSLRSRTEPNQVHHHHQLSESSSSTNEETSSMSSTASPTPSQKSSSKVKGMRLKAAKSVKRGIRKVDEFLHHVTGTKHHATDEDSEHGTPERPARRRTVSVPTRPITLHWGSPSKHSIKEGDTSSTSSSRSKSSFLFTPPRHRHRRTVSAEIAIQTDDIREEEEETQEDMASQHRKEQSLPAPPAVEIVEEEEQQPTTPSVFVVDDTPDPFLIDKEGDAASEEEKETTPSSTAASPAAHDVPLDVIEPQTPIPNLNKDVPPPPPVAAVSTTGQDDEDDEEEEDEQIIPELYVPSLILPTMFLPIPNTDPLTTLLNKYIYPPERRPPRDLTGEWQRSDFHTLVMTNSWRALARMARDRLVSADASDLTLILGLWHLRLSCLARLRLFNQTSAETTNLFTALAAIEPPEARAYVYERILPFELEVVQTRLKYWSGDHMGYLDSLSALLKKCRIKCRAVSAAIANGVSGHNVRGRRDPLADESLIPMWKERGARIALILASQMVDMKELIAAANLLEPLASSQGADCSVILRSSIGRIYLQGGYLDAAKRHFALVDEDLQADVNLKKTNKALILAAEGEWAQASEILRKVLEKDGENYVAVNNLAVALLSQGKLQDGIQVLEDALNASPSSVVVAEPFLFNLSTLYELRASFGLEKKKELLANVAKWSGDGLRTNCLKMPAN